MLHPRYPINAVSCLQLPQATSRPSRLQPWGHAGVCACLTSAKTGLFLGYCKMEENGFLLAERLSKGDREE